MKRRRHMAAEPVAPPSRPAARLRWCCRWTVWRCIVCLLSRSAQARNIGASPLFIAAQYGHTKAMELLVKAKAEVNKSMKGSVTPLMAAAWQGHTDCVRYLLGAGADAAVEMTGDNELIGVGPGATALQIATKHSKEDCRALLIKKVCCIRPNGI